MNRLPPPLLQIDSLVANYGKLDVLKGVSLNVAAGSLACVLGPPNAGKSTLAMSIVGLLRAKRGSIRVAGEEVRRRRPHEMLARGVALVPQNRALFRNLPVRENLLAGAWRETDRVRIEANAAALLERFACLKEYAAHTAGTLPLYEQQLLAMARALIMQPSLLLLDEPSAGLTASKAEDIFRLIADIHQEGVTVLLFEKNPKALDIADQAHLLDQGFMTFAGEPAQLSTLGLLERANAGQWAINDANPLRGANPLIA